MVRSISAGFYAHIDGVNGSFVPSQPGDGLLFVSADAYSFPRRSARPPLSLHGSEVVGRLWRPFRVLGRDPRWLSVGAQVAGSAYRDDGA